MSADCRTGLHSVSRGGGPVPFAEAVSLAAIEVGALVGAGFASGRELYEFFGIHGAGGRVGIALFAVLLAALGGLVLDAARRSSSRSYRSLTMALAGERLTALVDPLVAIGLFLGLAVTLAGAGALLAQLGWGPAFGGILGCGVLTCLVLWRGEAGLVGANVVVVPVLVCLVVVVGGWPHLGQAASWQMGANGLLGPGGRSATEYFLYNGLLAVVLFGSLGTSVRRRTTAWAAALLAALVLGLLAIVLLDAVLARPASLAAPLPMLALAGEKGRPVAILYAVALAGELVTTAIGNAFGLMARLELPARRWIGLGPVALATPLAFVGFVPLVRYGYRLVAVAGAAYLVVLGLGALARGGRGRRVRRRGHGTPW